MPPEEGIIASMERLICTCECGHRFYVSAAAWGMESICGKCGLTFKVSDKNARPAGEAADEQDLPPKSSRDHCARCGRAFRGDWDKHPTAEGAICHICANQYQDPSTTETAAAAIQPSEVPEPDAPDLGILDHDPDDYDDEPPSLGKRFEDFRETRAFRTGLWIAAISVIVLAIAATFIDTAPVGERPVRREAESAGGLGLFGPPEAWTESQQTSVRVVMYLLEAVFLFAPTFAALFVALAYAGRLPGYHWAASAVHVGIVSIGVGFVLYMVSMMLGAFLGIIGTGLAYIIAMVFVWVIYDLGLNSVLAFAAMRMMFGFLAGLIRLLAYGGLGLLLLD